MNNFNLDDNQLMKKLGPYLPLILGIMAILVLIVFIPLFVVAFLLGLSAYPMFNRYVWPYLLKTLKLEKKGEKP